MSYTVLLLGCGHSRDLLCTISRPDEFERVTLDMNPAVNPDIRHDLNITPWPFADDIFDEIHAYEVLEHLGRQGDYLAFFETFTEIWRALKPGGYLCATCPSAKSVWAWGDPGHTRLITPESLVFLNQVQYARDLDGDHVTSMTDYRFFYRADFEIEYCQDDGESHRFVLRAVKPSRVKE